MQHFLTRPVRIHVQNNLNKSHDSPPGGRPLMHNKSTKIYLFKTLEAEQLDSMSTIIFNTWTIPRSSCKLTQFLEICCELSSESVLVYATLMRRTQPKLRLS